MSRVRPAAPACQANTLLLSVRVMFRDRPADRSCDLTAADGRRLDRRRPRIIRGLGANQAEVDQARPGAERLPENHVIEEAQTRTFDRIDPGIESYTVHTAVGLPQSAMHCNRRRYLLKVPRMVARRYNTSANDWAGSWRRRLLWSSASLPPAPTGCRCVASAGNRSTAEPPPRRRAVAEESSSTAR